MSSTAATPSFQCSRSIRAPGDTTLYKRPTHLARMATFKNSALQHETIATREKETRKTKKEHKKVVDFYRDIGLCYGQLAAISETEHVTVGMHYHAGLGLTKSVEAAQSSLRSCDRRGKVEPQMSGAMTDVLNASTMAQNLSWGDLCLWRGGLIDGHSINQGTSYFAEEDQNRRTAMWNTYMERAADNKATYLDRMVRSGQMTAEQAKFAKYEK